MLNIRKIFSFFLFFLLAMQGAAWAADAGAAVAAVASDEMTWRQIATSSPAIIFYIAVVIFIFRYEQKQHQWNTERWEGLISATYLAVGPYVPESAKEALDYFANEFKKTTGGNPSAQDLIDAGLDLAKYTYNHKMASAQGGSDVGNSGNSAGVPSANSK